MLEFRGRRRHSDRALVKAGALDRGPPPRDAVYFPSATLGSGRPARRGRAIGHNLAAAGCSTREAAQGDPGGKTRAASGTLDLRTFWLKRSDGFAVR
jgi:hypothetical protein